MKTSVSTTIAAMITPTNPLAMINAPARSNKNINRNIAPPFYPKFENPGCVGPGTNF